MPNRKHIEDQDLSCDIDERDIFADVPLQTSHHIYFDFDDVKDFAVTELPKRIQPAISTNTSLSFSGCAKNGEWLPGRL